MPYKNARIHLRVTDEEKQSIIEKAAQARQSVSQYILSLSENKTIIVVDGADEVTRQLLKIGNNINQIAVVANTSRKNECELPSYYLKRITDYQVAINGEKPKYRMVAPELLDNIKQSGIQFAYFKKGDKYNIVFLRENEMKIDQLLKQFRKKN